MSNINSPEKLMKTIRGLNTNTWSESAKIIATHASLDSSTWNLGLLNSIDHPALYEQITALGENQRHPNPFFDLPILEPSIKYLAHGKMQYLYLSERLGSHEKLKFFAPIRLEKTKLFRRPIMRLWSQIYAPLGHPLVEPDDFENTIRALEQCLLNPISEEPLTLLFDDMPMNSKLCELLFTSESLANCLLRFSLFERSAFYSVPGQTYESLHVSRKRQQRMKIAEKKLEAYGKVRFTCATSSQAVKPALETLLELEKKSWKGRRGTALILDDNLASLARQNVLNMAEQGQCELYSLLVGRKTVAAIVFYKSQGVYFPWKTAFDEDYASYSVGNMLVNHAIQAISLNEDFNFIDSLAVESNEMANRFWPDNQQFCSLAIGLGNDGPKQAQKVMDELLLLRKTKAFAKKLLRR